MAKRLKKSSSDAMDEAYLKGVQEVEGRGASVLDGEKTGIQRLEGRWGGVEVEISPDAMRAVLRAVWPPDGGQGVVGEKILEALQDIGIVHGIDAAGILEVQNLADRPGGWKGEREIARGTPSGKARVVYPFLEVFEGEVDTDRPQVGEEGLVFTTLKETFTTEDLAKLKAAHTLVKAVGPGEVLAVLEYPETDVSGKDVFGASVASQNVLPLEAGENVTLGRDGTQYESSAYGYLLVLDGRISVAPPIWISPNKMAAYYVNLPQWGDPVSPAEADLRALLQALNVEVGIRDAAIEQVCEDLGCGKPLPTATLIAEGVRPQPGEDARLEFVFDMAEKPGEIQEDGSIDLRERNWVHNVSSGALLAEKVGPTTGRPGQTVLGTPVETTDGKDIEVKAGEGVRLDGAEGTVRLYADRDGVVVVRENLLSINEILQLKGDVDYTTGNLDVDKDIYIPGSVCSDFRVNAGGNVTIGGAVEPGAVIQVKGDLNVGKGILGEKTSVVVLGSLQTQFIQNATVIVRGDLWVGSYIHNASVRCGGKLTVSNRGGSRAGSVIGGQVCATRGVEVSRVGSSSTTGTVIALQTDPERMARLDKLAEDIRFCDENITKMMRTLGLWKFDKASIRRMLSRTPDQKRELYVKILNKINELLKYQQEAVAEETDLKAQIDRTLRETEIRITKELFGGVTIQIGSKMYENQTDTGPVIFQGKGDRIVVEEGTD